VALSGLDIYKKLPKTNCGECGFPTCLAFGMRLAAGQAQLDSCPYVSEEVKSELSEASAPPIRLVTIGKGDKVFKVGEEQVLFRHEKTFYNPPGLAVLIEDTASDAVINEKLKQAKESQFERVSQILRANLVAVKNSSGDAVKFADAVKKVKDGIDFPLILISDSAEAIKAALEISKDDKPLIYAANKDNFEVMAELAKEYNAPLAVKGSGSLEELAQLVEKITALGVKDIVLDSGARVLNETLRDLVYIRRSALKQKFRPLGYPTITFPCEEVEDDYLEAAFAGIYIMKYGGIVVLSSLEPWKVLPLAVLRQNIYTDPQQPMQVDEKIYPINNPDENSPVLITTNFSLTYFIVSAEIEASRVPTWLCVMNVEGLSVLTAWAAGKFVPEKIAPFVKKCGIEEKVKHRKILIPGYIAQISGELQDELADWEVMVGTREAADLPAFLKKWSA
jgi:acetyl-CoA decarbonylase/synthase complex subunit gamma